MGKERSDGFESDIDGIDELSDSEEDRRVITSVVAELRRQERGGNHAKTVKLCPGERMGWWSAQKFDRRVRMRALVMGAVNNERTKILLDTGANVSAVSESFARRLRLKRYANKDMQIDVQGIGKSKVPTTARATVKVTLGWQVVYEFEVWILPHHAGVDLILGTDFMIPAGIRLDLYNSTAKLPDEVVIPLIKSKNAELSESNYGTHIPGGPADPILVQSRLIAEFKLQRRQPSPDTHEIWVRRATSWVPTVVLNSRGKAERVMITNVSDKIARCPAHFPVVLWALNGDLPPDDGYVRLNSAKYGDWQVLAYEAALDKTLLHKEQHLYQEWLDRQPPAVEKREYQPPTGVIPRESRQDDNDEIELTCAQRWEKLERFGHEGVAPDPVSAADLAVTNDINSAIESDHTAESTWPECHPEAAIDPADWGDPSAEFAVSAECGVSPVDRGDQIAEFNLRSAGVTHSALNRDSLAEFDATAKRTPGATLDLPAVTSATKMAPGEDNSRIEMSIAEMRDLLAQATALCHQIDEGADSAAASVATLWQDEIDVSDKPFATDPEEDLRLRFVAAVATREDPTMSSGNESASELAEFERPGTEIDLEDYAHELAFLPDVVDLAPTVLDYAGDNVVCSAHTLEQGEQLVKMLKQHEQIMIASGNALPPPAYGAVCDIDVQGHHPIKQRARRTPLKHLKKLYMLLKGLLEAGLIAFSDSPWASPIVIVLKKNGVDIRLCIDYKMVNAITVLMEYAMPLVDDLLTELESYLWFCSLDAASGFWAVMMTRRARKISAFVCALGHFEWLRMPFGLKNAPMIYQRLIDNALWGYVQPRGGWTAYADRIRLVEAAATTQRNTRIDDGTRRSTQLSEVTKFEADHRAIAETDPLQDLVDGPDGDMFKHGEADESRLIPVFGRRSFVDDICFGGATFEECLATLDQLLSRFTECRISISFTKSIFVQQRVDFLSHEISADGVGANPKKLAAIAELPFPKSKKGMQAFLGALNYYSRFIQNLPVYGAVLYQLKEADFSSGDNLSAARSAFAELKTKVMQAPILRHFDSAKDVYIMLFANDWALSSTLMQYHDNKLHPVRFGGRVLKENEVNYHPAEKEVLALLHVLKVNFTLLAGKTLNVFTRFSTLEWVYQSKSLYGRATSFAVLLSPFHLKVKRIRERDADFVQLLQSSITPHVGLEESLAHIAPPSKNSALVRLDPELLYAHVPAEFAGFVLSFDGSAKTEKNGGYGSCSWILWRLPNWDIEIAASAYLSSTTVNIAEYTGMNNGVSAALDRGITDLIIVGDSRLAIQQSMGVIACKKETLQLELARHKTMTGKLSSVRYLHVVRYYNSAADSLATEALEDKAGRVVLSGSRKTELQTLNKIPEMLYLRNSSVETVSPEASAQITAVTRQQTRHVRFEDEDNTQNSAKQKKQATSRDAYPQPSPGEAGTEVELPQLSPPRFQVEDQAQLEVDESRVPDSADIDPVVVQAERRRRISKAQDEELKWSDVKMLLRGELDKLTHQRTQRASKIADDFVLSEDGLLYYLGQRRRSTNPDDDDLQLRLVVPTTLIDEVLHNCHNSIEGGHQGIVRTFHRVKAEFYWVGLYGDTLKHVNACEDCNTSKSRPQLRGYSPGNVVSEYPFQLVSMDFVIPLPKTQRGNTALLLFQDHFTGFVIAKAMSDTGALEVAKVFEECVFRRFGAPSLIRHDRDPRFMSEVFQAFAELMQSRSRATLSYRPQANGQQERSVKTMVQTIRVYVEDPLQADWDDIAEKMVHAINNSRDTTRRETPFYLVHGWDAQSTLKAMTSTLKADSANSADAAQWRRESNRQREIALRLAKDYQVAEKKRRAEEHNARLGRREREAIPSSAIDPESANTPAAEPTRNVESADDQSAESTRTQASLFKEGDQVWLFMERVKPGLKKKLAHRWHGPFRVKKKVEEFAYELELPDKSGYRFYPVVHVSRLKAVTDLGQRPSTQLVDELGDDQRFDFDEELLPEDSWERDQGSDKFEVEAILDDDMPLSTSTNRAQRLFKVKWVGYDEPTWEPLANLSCGGLLFDYLQQKKRENRLQMAQVADED